MQLLAPKAVGTSLHDMVEEIRKSLLEECDFVKEAENIKEYQRFLTQVGSQFVLVPKVYDGFTTKKIIVMERFFGVSLSDVAGVKKRTEHPDIAVINALNTWLASLLQCQIYHADLHAGNVMVLEDGRVGFIDFGIVGRISPLTWTSFTGLLTALMNSDYKMVAHTMVGIGATEQKVDEEKFAQDIEAFWVNLNETMHSNTDADPDRLIEQMLLSLVQVCKRYGVKFPREFTLLLKQLLYFDRYIHLLAPKLDMFHDERIALTSLR